MNAVKWVLIDQTAGATTSNGEKLSADVLSHIAEAVASQVNQEFATEWGAQATLRVGANPQDIQPGEWVYAFLPSLPDAPGASAYHDINGGGVPFAFCAVQTCGSLYGPNGVSVDASHEILETAGDEGANLFANDNKGLLHAVEMCDAVEIQTYGKTCRDGTIVQVSNWLLRAWFIPGATGPYEYMSMVGLNGAVAPAGPLTTAQGNGGNYQIVSKAEGSKQVFATGREFEIKGTRHKGETPNWSSRAARRMTHRAYNIRRSIVPMSLLSRSARIVWLNDAVARARYARTFGLTNTPQMRSELAANAAMTPVDFIAQVGPAAQQSAQQTAIPASFTVADAALESGWGGSQLAQQAHNLFGIKADASWNGPTVSMPTREYENGQWVTAEANWRSYPDWLSSIQDHATFLQNQPRYASAFQCTDGPDFATAIANCGYATDPNYASEIISIINGRNLTQLDA